VKLVAEGEAQVVMKGLIDTSVLLKAVLDKEFGLRTENVLSHVAVADVGDFDRLFYITDAAMNIAPDVTAKKQIIENVVQVANALGNFNPKVACVCAVEKVNPKMQATLDAAELVRMNQSGELTGCVVAGPFALDNAVSIEAAKHKGIDDPVAGNADILLMPSIEAGNMLYKSIVFFAKGKIAGIVVGVADVRKRADGNEHLFAIAREGDVACPVATAA
jgi:phosphate butyryltransferase